MGLSRRAASSNFRVLRGTALLAGRMTLRILFVVVACRHPVPCVTHRRMRSNIAAPILRAMRGGEGWQRGPQQRFYVPQRF